MANKTSFHYLTIVSIMESSQRAEVPSMKTLTWRNKSVYISKVEIEIGKDSCSLYCAGINTHRHC